VAAQEALERLVQGKAGVDGARPGQHEHEARQHPPAAADRERAEVPPVDLPLLAGQGLQTQVGFRARGRPDRADPAPHLDGGAGETALTDHDVETRGAQAQVLLQRGDQEGLIGIERGRANLRAGADEALDGVADGVVMNTERGGDRADAPVFRVVEPADLRSPLTGSGSSAGTMPDATGCGEV